jgi:ribosomal protein S18 acetylase RimI-like enzyme
LTSSASAPPGHVQRPPVEADAASIAALYASIESALHGESETAETDVRFTWEWPRFDLARDAWMITAGDRVVAYAWVWGPRLRVPRVEFDCTLQLAIEPGTDALAPALLERMESRVREMAHEQGISEPPTLVLTASSLDEKKREALLTRGYQRGRTFFHMERGLDSPFPAPRWPEGAEVAAFRPGIDDADVHDTINDAFAEHFRWMREPLEEWRALRHHDFAPGLTFIVRHEGRAVAASVNYRARHEGWIGMLGVRRAWRRRGLASALLLHSFAAFQRAGVTRAILGVDSENADDAVRIYEAVGMRVTRRNDFYSRTLE